MSKKIRKLFILIQIFLVFSIAAQAVQNEKFAKTNLTKIRFSGQLKNLPKGLIKLNLEEDINRKISKNAAEIKVDKNGRFKFEGYLVPHIYTLKLNQAKTIMLAIDKGQNIVILGDAENANSIKIKGSPDTGMLESYEKFRKESLNRLVISVRNQIKDLQGKNTSEAESKIKELAKLEVINYERHKDELIEFIKKEMGASIAVYATSIRWSGENNIAFLNDLARQFETDHPNLEITEKLKEKVKILVSTSIGGKVAEIKMPDQNGEIIALDSFKAKYILVDFWGSWCAPCRRESSELRELYQAYQPLGFEIYGVGLETEKANWLKAIEQDGRNWTNVSTFQEFETPASFDYAVTSLPANFLIDRDGRIVAKNLHGTELKEMLENLFSDK